MADGRSRGNDRISGRSNLVIAAVIVLAAASALVAGFSIASLIMREWR